MSELMRCLERKKIKMNRGKAHMVTSKKISKLQGQNN
jgi:hypothetical protein